MRALHVHHLAGDRAAFRRELVGLGFMAEDATVSPELYYEYMGFFYEPFSQDGEYLFTREYTSRSLAHVFDSRDPRYGQVPKQSNMPPDFVLAEPPAVGPVAAARAARREEPMAPHPPRVHRGRARLDPARRELRRRRGALAREARRGARRRGLARARKSSLGLVLRHEAGVDRLLARDLARERLDRELRVASAKSCVCIFAIGVLRDSSRRIARGTPTRSRRSRPKMRISFMTILSETNSGTGLKPFTPASTIRPPVAT